MANKRITDFDALTAVESDDELVIWDTSAGSTKKTTVEDLVAGEAALADIYTARGSTAQTGIGTSFVKVTGFASDGLSDGATADATNNKITVVKAGNYKISFDVSFSGTANTTFDFEIYVNGASVDIGLERKLGTAGDVGNSGCGRPVTIAAGHDVEVYVKADGASKSITPIYMNLDINRQG